MIRIIYPEVAQGWHLAGMSAYLPNRVVRNSDIEKSLGIDPGWIERRTGIKERRHASASMSVTALGLEAARRALGRAGVEPNELAALIFATTSPTRVTPGLGYTMQYLMGAHQAAVMDVNAGCSGFVHGLHLGGSLASTGQFRSPILLVGAEKFSPMLDPGDRSTSVLFADGSGAVVLKQCPGMGLICTAIGSNGFPYEGAEVAVGGAAPAGATVRMDGRYVTEYIERNFMVAANSVLEGAEMELRDVDYVIPHQANVNLIRAVAGRCGVTEKQLLISGDRYGNTGTASIPVTMQLHEQRLHAGGTALLVSLGGGMNWASALVRFGNESE